MAKHIDLSRQRKRLLALSKSKVLAESERAYLSRMAGWVQPVYDYETEQCEYGTLERSGSSIYGCPWKPPGTSGAMCQLDLDEIRSVTGRDFGSGLLEFYCNDIERETEGLPSTASNRLTSREEVEETGKPEPFLGANLTPQEYFESLGAFDYLPEPFYPYYNEVANLSKPNAEYELLCQVDPERARDMWLVYEMAMEQVIKDSQFYASLSKFGTAERIVNWVDSSDEYYKGLVETSDSEILEELEEWQEAADLFVFNESGGLFKWPVSFQDRWRDSKKEAGDFTPFFKLQGMDFGMEKWEFFYRETAKSNSNKKSFEFTGFGQTGGRYGRSY